MSWTCMNNEWDEKGGFESNFFRSLFESHILNKHHVRRKNTVDKVVMGTVQTLKKQEKNTTRKYNNSKRHPMDVQIRFNNISGVVYNRSEENIAILYVHSDFVVVTAL